MLEEALGRIRGIAAELEKSKQLRDGILHRVAKGDNPVFAELAREVRSGRMTLQEAAASNAYREELAVAADRLTAAMQGMTREDIENLGTGQSLDEQLAELAEDPEVPDSRRRVAAPDVADDGDFDGPIMTAPRVDRSTPAEGPQRARWARRWN